jgi:hypothetical protein
MTLAAGTLVCACGSGSGSGSSTGVLEGTAPPCIAPHSSSSQHAWEVQVVLRRGSTVIAKRMVLDSQNTGDPVIDEVFSFSEPSGSYSVSGATPNQQPVVIKAGTTSTVQLVADCT